MTKCTARINSDYWLVVSEEGVERWTVKVWGPLPLRHNEIHPSVAKAKAASYRIAKEHFQRNRLEIDVPEVLLWKVALQAH